MYGFVEFQEKAWSLLNITHWPLALKAGCKQAEEEGEGDNWWCLLRSAGQTQGTHLPHKEEEGED